MIQKISTRTRSILHINFKEYPSGILVYGLYPSGDYVILKISSDYRANLKLALGKLNITYTLTNSITTLYEMHIPTKIHIYL